MVTVTSKVTESARANDNDDLNSSLLSSMASAVSVAMATRNNDRGTGVEDV